MLRTTQQSAAEKSLLADFDLLSRFAWALAERKIQFVARRENQWVLFAHRNDSGATGQR